jgi:uncharacterized protein YecE (DUF72 family)
VPASRGSTHSLRIGCSGWNYAHWRNGVFYPPRLAARNWLAFYARDFDTVEINATFYRLPRTTAVARWVEETPDGFVFAVKVSRYVTHVKRLKDVEEHLPLLYQRIEPLLRSPKLGPFLWQLPPTFRCDRDRLAHTLEHLHDGHRHAFEFRHPSWFQSHELTADFTFVRFHAGTRGRNGNYSQTELQEWSERLARWSGKVDVFAYFNNDWEGFAVHNARDLQAMLLRYARHDAVA